MYMYELVCERKCMGFFSEDATLNGHEDESSLDHEGG